jgi:hypothetical protein
MSIITFLFPAIIIQFLPHTFVCLIKTHYTIITNTSQFHLSDTDVAESILTDVLFSTSNISSVLKPLLGRQSCPILRPQPTKKRENHNEKHLSTDAR